MTDEHPPAGRVYDAYLHLLDRQVVDPDGDLVCKVDDVELTDDGTGTLGVAAILTGPAVLGPRVGGIVGRSMVAIQRRLHPGPEPGPGRIDFSLVTEIGTVVTVNVRPDQLSVRALEDWARTRIIAAIPGASNAPE